MSTVIRYFPDGLPVLQIGTRGQQWKTLVEEFTNGRRQKTQKWLKPKHNTAWKLWITDATIFQRVRDFITGSAGQFETFYFFFPNPENYVRERVADSFSSFPIITRFKTARLAGISRLTGLYINGVLTYGEGQFSWDTGGPGGEIRLTGFLGPLGPLFGGAVVSGYSLTPRALLPATVGDTFNFKVPEDYVAGSLIVRINGVVQQPTADYSTGAGNFVFLVNSLPDGSVITGSWIRTAGIGETFSLTPQALTYTGTPGVYTVPSAFVAGSLIVYDNGRAVTAGTDYTITGSTVTFLGTVPAVSDWIAGSWFSGETSGLTYRVQPVVLTATADPTQFQFLTLGLLDDAPIDGSLIVYVNGVAQLPGLANDYTVGPLANGHAGVIFNAPPVDPPTATYVSSTNLSGGINPGDVLDVDFVQVRERLKMSNVADLDQFDFDWSGAEPPRVVVLNLIEEW